MKRKRALYLIKLKEKQAAGINSGIENYIKTSVQVLNKCMPKLMVNDLPQDEFFSKPMTIFKIL